MGLEWFYRHDTWRNTCNISEQCEQDNSQPRVFEILYLTKESVLSLSEYALDELIWLRLSDTTDTSDKNLSDQYYI